MPKPRGKEHTTLTETAELVVKQLRKVSGIKMIAPGEIKTTRRSGSGRRYITVVTTTAGCELIISGQSAQKVAVHTDNVAELTQHLQNTKALRDFVVSERSRIPGQ